MPHGDDGDERQSAHEEHDDDIGNDGADGLAAHHARLYLAGMRTQVGELLFGRELNLLLRSRFFHSFQTLLSLKHGYSRRLAADPIPEQHQHGADNGLEEAGYRRDAEIAVERHAHGVGKERIADVGIRRGVVEKEGPIEAHLEDDADLQEPKHEDHGHDAGERYFPHHLPHNIQDGQYDILDPPPHCFDLHSKSYISRF